MGNVIEGRTIRKTLTILAIACVSGFLALPLVSDDKAEKPNYKKIIKAGDAGSGATLAAKTARLAQSKRETTKPAVGRAQKPAANGKVRNRTSLSSARAAKSTKDRDLGKLRLAKRSIRTGPAAAKLAHARGAAKASKLAAAKRTVQATKLAAAKVAVRRSKVVAPRKVGLAKPIWQRLAKQATVRDTAVIGESLPDTLDADDDVAYYILVVEETTVVTIDVLSDEFDTFLDLYDTDDPASADQTTLLADDDDGGAGLGSRLSETLEAGTYLLAVSSVSGSGAFDLALSKPTVFSIAIGEPAVDTLLSSSEEHYYTLEIEATTTVVIDLTSDDIDAFLVLYDTDSPGGATDSALLAVDDDGGEGFNSRISRVLSPGTYLIHVSTIGSAGGYELLVTEEALTLFSIDLGEIQAGSLPSSSAPDYYTLELQADAVVTIDLTSDDFDTFLEIHDTDNPGGIDLTSLLVMDDDGGEGTNSRVRVNLTQGTYLIVTSAFSGSGPYTLTVIEEQPATVASITIGETASGFLPSAGAIDYYVFSLDQTTTVSVDLTSEEFDATLELHDTDNPLVADFTTLLAFNDDGGEGLNSRIARVLGAGTYLIAASALNGSGAYNLQLSEVTLEVSSISLEESVTGNVPSSTDIRYFTLDLAEGTTVTIDLVSDEIDAFLRLYDTADPVNADFSTEIAANDDGGANLSSRIVRALPAGTYLIAASSISGGGSFTLSVSQADFQVAAISLGQPETGALTTSASTDYYSLTLAEATPVAIDLSSTEFDPLLEVYATDNPQDATLATLLARDDDGGDGLNSRITRVLPPGTYLLAASSFGGFGVYEIEVSAQSIEALTIALGDTRAGTLPTAADVTFYTLTLEQDAVVAIDLRSAELDAFLELYDTDSPLSADFSTLVAADDDGGLGFDSRIIRALTAGTYVVAASSFSGFGNYELEVSEEFLQIEAIALGETRSGNLETSSDTHYFTLTLPEGAGILIDLRSDELDAFLELFDTDSPLNADFFSQLAADDDGGEGLNSRIERALPGGTYLIAVSSIRDGGSYSLTVTESDIRVTSISLGETRSGSLSGSDDVQYLTLRLDESATVAIDITSDEFDTFLQVFDTDNPADAGFFNELAANDDGGDGLNSRIVLPLAPGTYLIAATSFSGFGAFSLVVSEVTLQLKSIAVGETQSGELLSNAERDFYTLTLGEKATVTIDLSSDEFDAFLELFAADNPQAADATNQLAIDDDGGEGLNSRITFSLNEGTYLIGVSALSGSGPYTLSVTESESEVLSIALGDTKTGELASLTAIAYYALSVPEGTSIVIDAMSDEFDTYLELFQADNLFDATFSNLLELDDDGGVGLNSQIQTSVGSGIFIIAVSSLDGPGAFTLSVSGGGDVPVVAIGLDETQSSTLASVTDFHFYTISLSSETIVTIDVRSDDFDTFLDISRGDNPFSADLEDAVASDDDGGEGLNSRIEIPLSAGTYLLAVSSFSGSGDYEIQVSGGNAVVGPNARAAVTLDFEGSGSVNLIDDGVTSGIVAGAGSEIVIELFVKPVGRSVQGGVFILDIDTTLVELTDFKPVTGHEIVTQTARGAGTISEGTGVVLDEGFFGSATLTTLVDVTGRQLIVGVREFLLTDVATGATDTLRMFGQLTFNAFSPTTVITDDSTGPIGPIALDLDPTSGDQGQRTSSERPAPGDVVVIELAATEGALATRGLLAELQFDGKALVFETFTPADLFEGALLIPKGEEGSVQINLAFVGTSTAAGDAGSVGQFRFVVQDGFSDSTVVRITTGQYARASGSETMQIGSGGAAVIIGGGGSTGPSGLGPIALDADLAPGDQANRGLPQPAAGDEIVIDIVATEGALGATGILVRFRFDDKALAYVSFSTSDLFAGALVIPKAQAGELELNVALPGTSSGSDAGTIGQVTLRVLEEFEGTTDVVLTGGSYGGPGGLTPFQVGSDGATLTVGAEDGSGGGPPSPDFDGDGSVGFADFLAFAGQFGRAEGDPLYDSKFDLDQDGSIGFGDFLQFAGAFGS